MADVGVTTTTDLLALVVRRVAAMIVDSPSQVSERDQGIRDLRDALLETLDVGEHSDPPPSDIQADARTFCRDRCTYSDDRPPGDHLMCRSCTLKKHTIDPYEGAAEKLVRESVEERKTTK